MGDQPTCIDCVNISLVKDQMKSPTDESSYCSSTGLITNVQPQLLDDSTSSPKVWNPPCQQDDRARTQLSSICFTGMIMMRRGRAMDAQVKSGLDLEPHRQR